jgi:beta-phosphoglucomutase-like phosphatase (HAD superfamily)
MSQAPAPRRFDAVIFDNDGLLLDTEQAWTAAEEILFARRGREFTLEHKRAMLGTAGPIAHATLARLLELPDDGPALFSELQGLALEQIARSATPPRSSPHPQLLRSSPTSTTASRRSPPTASSS